MIWVVRKDFAKGQNRWEKIYGLFKVEPHLERIRHMCRKIARNGLEAAERCRLTPKGKSGAGREYRGRVIRQ